MFDFLPDYSTLQWWILAAVALFVGISKTGLPGIGIIIVPLLAMIFPSRMSTGLLLPILAMADVFAVAYYRRHADWKIILRLLPWALLGIGVGTIVVRYLNDEIMRPLIGSIILVLLVLNYFRQRFWTREDQIPSHWAFAAIMGLAAGLTTQLANAAGPIMVIYLLSMRLEKDKYIGTGAWYFLILNWLKIPLFILDGRITIESVKADLVTLPLIAVGAFLGILILKKIPLKWFNIIIQVLAAATAVKLSLLWFS
ncbi:MAG: sulfite exporter TauE/SafE family protein [Spirochaetaceae bacterium]|nr:sulfite exporter TauE/SafE family protein [Spirochaetaceae bacterium]